MFSHPDFQFSLIIRSEYYSATTVESVATAAESSTTGAASSTTVVSSTTAAESLETSALAALLPHDANYTATNATNKNTNFFIFFAFLICNTLLS